MTLPLAERLFDMLTQSPAEVLTSFHRQGLLPLVFETEVEDFTGPIADTAPAGAMLHVDPSHAYVTGDAGAVSSVYATDCNLASGEGGFLRFPSFPELSPYLIVYFTGVPAGVQRTVLLTMQVYSTGGTVRVTGTNNPNALLVTHAGTGGATITVPIVVTPTAEGFASLLLQRVGETGFDWLGADLF
jgi:hypothetical protein